MDKITVDKSIEIKAEPQKIFDFIIDPHKFAEALPELQEISNLSPLPYAPGWQYDFKYFMGDALLNGTCHYKELEAPTLFKTYSPTLSDSWWTHTIAPSADGSTYRVRMEYTVPDGLISRNEEALVIAATDQAIERMTKRLKGILEGQAAAQA